MLELAVVELRERFHLNAREILVPFAIDLGENIKVTVPQLGDKKQILEYKKLKSYLDYKQLITNV